MAAESLPFSFGTLSNWELEAWYEDLQEVLSSEENGGAYIQPPETEQEELKTFTTLDPASLVWLAEEPRPGGITNNGQSPCSPESSQSSLAQEEEEDQGEQGRKRKRRNSEQSPARNRKQSVKEKEQENERKVARLVAENERLKREIERLTQEVDMTRQALIDRMVSLPRS